MPEGRQRSAVNRQPSAPDPVARAVDGRRPTAEGTPSRLPRAVYFFGATSLLNDCASEMIYPLLPAFVTRTLGGGALALGVLDGLADSVAAGFKLLSGYLADRPRLRGPLVVGGYAAAAVIRPLMAMAAAAWHVVALRGADRVGKGIRTSPRDTMIAEVTAPGIRGRAFGVHRAADHAGAIIGPLTAAGLIAAGMTVRGVFWLAVIPGALAVIAAWLAVRDARKSEVRGQRSDGTVSPHPSPLTTDPARSPERSFVPLVLVLALAAFLRAPETLLILRVQDLGVSAVAIPVLWAGLHVVRSSVSVPGGILVDRWGARRTLALGWIVYAGLAWSFARAATVGQAWVVFLAFGLVAALTESPERTLIAKLAPGGRQGRGFGWYHGSVSAVALPGAALFGWIYEVRGGPFALTLSAAVTLVAVAALVLSSSAWARGRSAN
jgi:MFS family permease